MTMYQIKEDEVKEIKDWLYGLQENLKDLFKHDEAKNKLPDQAINMGICLGRIERQLEMVRNR